ncbi:MAG: hypothetical protein ACOY45_04545 [Pseudomonadota bacterium]
MRKPVTSMMLGHPMVGVPISCIAVFAIIGALNGTIGWFAAAIFGFAALTLAKHARARKAYIAWKREWDDMAAPQTPLQASSRGVWKPWVGAALLALLGLFLATRADDPLYAGALVYLVLAVAIAGGVAWRMKRPRRGALTEATKPFAVTVCVRKSLLPVPSITAAYRALPSHCHALFAAQEQRRMATGS